MPGFCAEPDAPVGLGAEVTAEEAVAVEVNEPATSRALAFHATSVGLERFMALLSAVLCGPVRPMRRRL